MSLAMRFMMTSAVFAFLCLANANAVLQTNAVERHYDRFGRPVGISLNGERRTEIVYDEATGRIASMRVAGADELFRWEYEPGSDLKKTLRYPNGATVEWEYEPHRDLVTLVSNDVYSSYRYEYDAAGRRVAKNDERYEYNVRGELVLATNVVTGAEFAYCYDDIGNRQWSCEFGTNCVYAANELNQYTNIVRGGVHELSAFDLDGNQTNVVTATGEWAVEYNGENRPVLWRRKSDGATIRMSYDRMGRRVRKNDETFVYDGYLNISQTIWDPTEPIATRPLVWREAGGNAFCFHDGNKDVVDFVPVSSASMARHYDYAPFGAGVDEDSSGKGHWRFSSEYGDQEAGLIYYNCRHYEPVAGRWLSVDPVCEQGGLHLYSFCENKVFDCYDYIGDAPQFIYPGTRVVYDPKKGSLIQLSQDLDYGGRLDVGLGASFSLGGSFLFSKHEFIGASGCYFYCFSVTSQLAGFSAGVSVGNGSALSVTVGKWGAYVEMPGLDNGFGVGYGVSLAPAEVSYRLFCFALNPVGSDGCPCEESAPPSALGLQN